MLPSIGEVKNGLLVRTPKKFRPLVQALIDGFGWLLLFVSVTSLVTDRNIVREFGIWVAANSPTWLSIALTTITSWLLSIVSVWHHVTHLPIDALSKYFAVSIPLWSIDALIIVAFLISNAIRLLSLNAKVKKDQRSIETLPDMMEESLEYAGRGMSEEQLNEPFIVAFKQVARQRGSPELEKALNDRIRRRVRIHLIVSTITFLVLLLLGFDVLYIHYYR